MQLTVYTSVLTFAHFSHLLITITIHFHTLPSHLGIQETIIVSSLSLCFAPFRFIELFYRFFTPQFLQVKLNVFDRVSFFFSQHTWQFVWRLCYSCIYLSHRGFQQKDRRRETSTLPKISKSSKQYIFVEIIYIYMYCINYVPSEQQYVSLFHSDYTITSKQLLNKI